MARFLNHRPDQFGIWFDYVGNRYKDYYDVRLKTGEVFTNCYPNSHYFNCGRRDFEDKDVDQIRLKPDNELHQYAHTGADRLERNLNMFSGNVPELPCGFPVRGNEWLKEKLNELGQEECECCQFFGPHDCKALPDLKWGPEQYTELALMVKKIFSENPLPHKP